MNLYRWLRLFSIIGFLACLYPIMTLLTTFDGWQMPWGEFGWCGLLVAAFTVGYGVQRLLNFFERRNKLLPPLRKALFGVWLLFCASLPWWAIAVTPMSFSIGLSAILLLGGWFGGQSVFYSYRTRLNGITLLTGVGLNLATLLVFVFIQQNYERTFSINGMTVAFFIALCSYILLKNQGHLDRLMERRQHDVKRLPLALRRYNLLLSLSLVGLILFCYLFRHWLSILVLWIGELLRQLVSFLLQIIFWFFNLFRSNETAPASGGGASDGAMPLSESINIPWLVFVVIALSIILFVYRKQIWRALCELAGRIWQKLYQWYMRMRKADRLTGSGHGDYYDTVEQIDQVVVPTIRKQHSMKKMWKQYRNMRDGVEKYRMGYALLLRWLSLHKVSLRQSDTSWEIYQKGKVCLSNAALERVTESYNQLRYEQMPCTPQMTEQMDDLVAMLMNHLPK